jgi:hypothetical protein
MNTDKESPQHSCTLTALSRSFICPECNKTIQIPYEMEGLWEVYNRKEVCPECKKDISKEVLQGLFATGVLFRRAWKVADFANTNPLSKRNRLTKMQKAFCLELVKLGGVYGNKTLAARNAGAAPAHADVQAQKWLGLLKVQAELARLSKGMNKREERDEEKGDS